MTRQLVGWWRFSSKSPGRNTTRSDVSLHSRCSTAFMPCRGLWIRASESSSRSEKFYSLLRKSPKFRRRSMSARSSPCQAEMRVHGARLKTQPGIPTTTLRPCNYRGRSQWPRFSEVGICARFLLFQLSLVLADNLTEWFPVRLFSQTDTRIGTLEKVEVTSSVLQMITLGVKVLRTTERGRARTELLQAYLNELDRVEAISGRQRPFTIRSTWLSNMTPL